MVAPPRSPFHSPTLPTPGLLYVPEKGGSRPPPSQAGSPDGLGGGQSVGQRRAHSTVRKPVPAGEMPVHVGAESLPSSRVCPCREGVTGRHLRPGPLMGSVGASLWVSAELTAPVPAGETPVPTGLCVPLPAVSLLLPAARPSSACLWGHGAIWTPSPSPGPCGRDGWAGGVRPGLSLLRTAETRFLGRFRLQPLGLTPEPLSVLTTERLEKLNPSLPVF